MYRCNHCGDLFSEPSSVKTSYEAQFGIRDGRYTPIRCANAHWDKHGLSGLDSISRDIMRTNESIQLLNDYVEGAREENLEEVMNLLDECGYIISI